MSNNVVIKNNLDDDAVVDVGTGKIRFVTIMSGEGPPLSDPAVPEKDWLYIDLDTTPPLPYHWDPDSATWGTFGVADDEIAVVTGPIKTPGSAVAGSDPELYVSYSSGTDQHFLQRGNGLTWPRAIPIAGVRVGHGAPAVSADSPEALYLDVDTGTVYAVTGGPSGPYTWQQFEGTPGADGADGTDGTDGADGADAPTSISVYVSEAIYDLLVGDGQAYIAIPASVNGKDVTAATATLISKSTSGTVTIQLARGRQAAPGTAHAFVDILSTRLTIDVNEFSSTTATTPLVINGSNDDVATGDLIRIDVDVTGTAAAGLIVTITFN